MGQDQKLESKKLEKRVCQNCQKEFTIEPENFEFYEKIKVPAPTWCPECRGQRRMNFNNVSSLYKRKCDSCGENIIAVYPEEVEFPVYCPKCWWSDKWDASDYARDYDLNKPFFEQLRELKNEVPRVSLEVDYQRNINSPYANLCGPLKNCYLTFLTDTAEDCAYIFSGDNLKDCFDCTNVASAENSYGLFYSAKMYHSFFSRECENCLNVYFCKNLKNCQNCFGCVNLRNKSYCIFNKQYSKEDYQKQLQELLTGSHQAQETIKQKVEEFFLRFPNKYIHGESNLNVSGDYIYHCKNTHNSYGIIEGENVKYCKMLEMGPTKDCYDYDSWGQKAEKVYEAVHCGDGINNIKFSNGAWQSYNVEYSDNPLFSHDIFGCVFTNKKSYCILNKQYSKGEYFPMVEKIKKHMNEMPYIDKQDRVYKYGEFFPPELSPFAYNETIAQEYFPLTKEEAKKKGYRWKEREKRNYNITLKTEDIPDNIKDVDNSILKEVIECATNSEEEKAKNNCSEAFKIIPQELEFYKKMNLPLPRYCPNCRHHQRLKNRNPLKLYKRTCMKEGCNNTFETTYAPNRPEIVYCEECYNREVN